MPRRASPLFSPYAFPGEVMIDQKWVAHFFQAIVIAALIHFKDFGLASLVAYFCIRRGIELS